MSLFFFFNDTATTEIYTLSLHDALPICGAPVGCCCAHYDRANLAARLYDAVGVNRASEAGVQDFPVEWRLKRSEEHTSELQSRLHLVCRLLLEKKKITLSNTHIVDICTR